MIAPLQVPADLTHPLNEESFPLPPEIPPLGVRWDVPLAPPGFGHISTINEYVCGA